MDHEPSSRCSCTQCKAYQWQAYLRGVAEDAYRQMKAEDYIRHRYGYVSSQRPVATGPRVVRPVMPAALRADRLARMSLRPGETQTMRDTSVARIRNS